MLFFQSIVFPGLCTSEQCRVRGSSAGLGSTPDVDYLLLANMMQEAQFIASFPIHSLTCYIHGARRDRFNAE